MFVDVLVVHISITVFRKFDRKTSVTHIIDVDVVVLSLLLRMLCGSGTSKSDAQDQAALLQ